MFLHEGQSPLGLLVGKLQGIRPLTPIVHWTREPSVHEINISIAFLIQQFEKSPGVSSTEIQRLEDGSDLILVEEAPQYGKSAGLPHAGQNST